MSNEDIEKMNFEQALQELESIVDGLEKGNVPLDQSISQYERGEALRNQCQVLLKAAEAKVEKIKIGGDGKAAGVTDLDE
ncbi:MAG: exodeoxyribonuclease VII small subunit [Nitratireductor sp.]